MKRDYTTLVRLLREGSYIYDGDSVVGCRPPTRLEQEAADAIETLVKCANVTDESWRAIADELNEYKKLGTVEHIRELIDAENDKRLKVIPVAKYNTCGTCKSFKRTEGKTYGICKNRNSVLYQSRKACSKEYVPKGAESDVAE